MKKKRFKIKEIHYSSGRSQNFEGILLPENNEKSKEHVPNNQKSPYDFDIPEPEYQGNMYRLNLDGQLLDTLERKEFNYKMNYGATAYIFGAGSKKMKHEVKGPKSPIRLQKGKHLILIKTYRGSRDPKDVFKVIYKKSCYILEFDIQNPGEYAIASKQHHGKYFLFGVDE